MIAFGPDSRGVIPANVPHRILNTGADEIRLVAAFSTAPVEVFLPDGAPIARPWRSQEAVDRTSTHAGVPRGAPARASRAANRAGRVRGARHP